MEQRELYEGELTENEVKGALNKTENNKTSGYGSLTKEFWETFWLEIKSTLLLSFKKGFLTEELSNSQKQAVIKLFHKKLIKNWKAISILNSDIKLISKALAKRMKKLLSSLILPNQIASSENRVISKGDRLISLFGKDNNSK